MIEQVPLSSPFFRAQVEDFLKANGLRTDALDAYYVSRDADGSIIAGAGIAGDVLKCLAVSSAVRSEGLLAPLVSAIISDHQGRCLKVFTKPEYQPVFESLGFHLLASAPLAVLMENGRGLEEYCDYLRSKAMGGRCGVIVMNANPFTLGHQHLFSSALKQVDHLYVIPVLEDASEFPYTERFAMISAACHSERSEESLISVLEGSAYIISAATFPTYFLKDLSAAAETQMQLDLDLFRRHIAPALGNPTRFVGSEPLDPLTARYNELMPEAVVIPRLEMASARPTAEENYFSCGGSKNQFSPAIASRMHADAISASAVRAFLSAGRFREAAALCPETSWPYLMAALAERVLRLELDTPLKPGLVGPDGPGAHRDMNYNTMSAGIRALRPYWSRMALAETPEALRQLGIEAEDAMLAATGGVNTHRGAIFCFGITLNAWGQSFNSQKVTSSSLRSVAGGLYANKQCVSTLRPRGAVAVALSGYRLLFDEWLPYYRSLVSAVGAAPEGASALYSATEGASLTAKQLLLLKIMSTLEDTCVIKRSGKERADEVKKEAKDLLEQFSEEKLKEMCIRYAQEGISPGGAADMLALTIFIDSIQK